MTSRIKRLRPLIGRLADSRPVKPETQQPRQQQEAKQQKLGKKEAALVAAQNPNTETTLGELMARRQGGLNS